MAKLQISLIWPGCAQGRYAVKARGYILAALSWGNADGPLAGWGPFAYVPVDPVGNGSFFFSGRRGIPPETTHVWARCISHDFKHEESISTEIAPRFLLPQSTESAVKRFSIFADLHLVSKPWKIRQALRNAASEIVFLLGDLTNDGILSQFEAFEDCIAESAPDKIILPVIGNHDVTHPKVKSGDGCEDYAAFQGERLKRATEMGIGICCDPDSLAWATRLGSLDIIGMQCVVSGRRFRFPEEKQLDWLEQRLEAQSDVAWYVILCHAPLLAHNPNRNDGQPYLDKNGRVQAMVDRTGNVLFLSGHTHVSPNTIRGSAEWDDRRNNLYLNCGSVVDTATEGEVGLMSADWKDGCVTVLMVSEDVIEIDTQSVTTGMHFPRGYYRFQKTQIND